MHEEYIQIDGKIAVVDRLGKIEPVIRENTSNIEEILKQENVIEYYQDSIQEQEHNIACIQKEIKKYRTIYKIGKKIGIVSFVGSLIGLFLSLSFITTLSQIPILVTFDLMTFTVTLASIITCFTHWISLKFDKEDLENAQLTYALTKQQLKGELERYKKLKIPQEKVESTSNPKKIDDLNEWKEIQNTLHQFRAMGKNIHLYKSWDALGILQKNLQGKYQFAHNFDTFTFIENYIAKQKTLKK